MGRETDHSPPASAKVKKMWIYTSTPPYAFMAQCLIHKAQGQLYLTTSIISLGFIPLLAQVSQWICANFLGLCHHNPTRLYSGSLKSTENICIMKPSDKC
jgi:hypothetical protein